MVTIMLRFRVEDFARWAEILVSRDELRREAGCRGRRVLRGAEDPSQVVLLLEWDELARYRAYAATGVVQTPEGRERAGIEDPPEEWVLHNAEDVEPWRA
jgi:heme-degrading monooxygenase HmoA